MAVKTPAQVAQEFLTQLAALKTDVDISLSDSDWYVKAQAMGGTMAGIYSDQSLLANDPYPQSARTSALAQHLQTYFTAPNNVFLPSQSASGFLGVTGDVGTVVTTAVIAQYLPNGNTYQFASGFTMATTSALVPVVSVNTGQDQNLLSGATLTIISPPAGLNSSSVASGDFTQGRDQETDAEAAARILAFIQSPPAGGTQADYIRWAQEASPLVTNASVMRFPNGFGTVGVVITAGTTNIPVAIENGDPVVVVPTQTLIDAVQAYIDSVNPITDCATVYAPTTVPINVSVSAWFAQGDATTVLPGQTLSQGQLLTNAVLLAIYQTPPGGRIIEGQGYVVKSDIEQEIDQQLSAEPFETGSLPVLNDRYVSALSLTGPNFSMSPVSVAIAGTITVVSM